MAKAAAKSTTKSATTKARAPRTKAENNNNIEKASEEVLQKLQELGLDEQLQRDIQWCLGSYRSDSNPVGLYDNMKKAVAVLKTEKDKKTKGVTAKMISDLERFVKEEN
jgi:hypothetical protein